MTVHAAVRDAELLYERAFQQYWRPVFRFTLAWTNDWSAAEDLTQEAFVRLWQNRDKVDWNDPVLPWLLVTGRRLATDRFELFGAMCCRRTRASPSTSPRGLSGSTSRPPSRRCPGSNGRLSS